MTYIARIRDDQIAATLERFGIDPARAQLRGTERSRAGHVLVVDVGGRSRRLEVPPDIAGRLPDEPADPERRPSLFGRPPLD